MLPMGRILTAPQYKISYGNFAPIAQLDRVAGYEPVGWPFESAWARQPEIYQISHPLTKWDFVLYLFMDS